MTSLPLLQEYAVGLSQPPLLEGRSGRPSGSTYDEVLLPDGSLRPAWKGLAEVAIRLTDSDLRRVDDEVRRFLSNDGVTYARPGQEQGPWHLDPIPLVVDAPEWAPLETALAQRAELLNAVLVDLYGPQRLLSHGIIPPAVVYGHPGFLRVMARPSVRDPRPLIILGTDLGRDSDGTWRVLADRAQAPSGMGYAMENRRVMSRVLPELYREASLHRMGPFFSALRSALMQSAGEDVAVPRVVVLSPGTHSETAYDQAFIASNLGFPLVEGSDLVVRHGSVWLRSMGRLEPVHVILRRVDAVWTDPLELRAGSRLGVAGLNQAIRRGRVRVVNGLGSAVIESAALHPYLEAACDLLLGESLRLPSVTTWWCGTDEGRERVLRDLDGLEVRRVDGTDPRHTQVFAQDGSRDPRDVPYDAPRRDSGDSADPNGASESPRPTATRSSARVFRDDALPPLTTDELRQLILREPHRWVGQERIALSQAPVFDGARVRPHPITLRTFTLRYGSSYRPLVGGIAFVADGDRGDGSVPTKDVWVLKADAGDSDQGLGEIVPLAAGQAAPPAVVPRVLEHMFWVGRYGERSETLLRLVLATHSLAEDFRDRPFSAGGASLQILLDAHIRLAGPPADRHDLDGYFRTILLDAGRRGSVAQSFASMRLAAEGVRDQLSSDIWRAFGSVDRAESDLVRIPWSLQVAESAGRMLGGVLALYGVTANMMRDPAWHMLEAGRALERSLQLSLLLRTITVRHGIDIDRLVLNTVLNTAESWVTHRRRYRGYVRPATVLDLLLKDSLNPRSLVFALTELRTHLHALPTSTGSTRPERLIDDILEHLDELDMTTLVTIGGADRPNLVHYLDGLHEQLTRVGTAVVELHLAAGPAPRSFGTGRQAVS